MLSALLGCASTKPAPKGQLVYCSYACTGAAGLGKDYCELIADVDSVPRVVVVLGEGTRYKDMKADYEALDWYMRSGQWKKDFEMDEKGRLPKDLKRGVLSEDGLYEVLSQEP